MINYLSLDGRSKYMYKVYVMVIYRRYCRQTSAHTNIAIYMTYILYIFILSLKVKAPVLLLPKEFNRREMVRLFLQNVILTLPIMHQMVAMPLPLTSTISVMLPLNKHYLLYKDICVTIETTQNESLVSFSIALALRRISLLFTSVSAFFLVQS